MYPLAARAAAARAEAQGRASASSVGSHDFNLHDFRLRVSNPRTIAYLHFKLPWIRLARVNDLRPLAPPLVPSS